MAKQQQMEEIEEDAGPVTETITYVPGNGDPATIKWAGHTFHANVAKEITGHPKGSETEKLNHHIIVSARNNPAFTVGDGSARKPRAKSGKPKTAEEYRAHLAKWLQDSGVDTADRLIERFAKERDLQQACEVGSSDYALIETLVMPRLHQLASADELNEQQVARLWLNHGYTQLPW